MRSINIILFYKICCFLLLLPLQHRAQDAKGLVAKYTFNNNNGENECGFSPAKLYNVLPVNDRFGNAGYACFLHGNADSYINLGSSDTLKPKEGSVSLWVKINIVTYNGKGVHGNPIILAKVHSGDDFTEAYSIGYNYDLEHIAVATTHSELKQAYVHPDKKTSLREWHHVAMTYDNDFLCYYLDGVLEGKVSKGFESKFLEGDSVLMGIYRNNTHERFFCGVVDDVEIYNRVLSPGEVKELYEAPNPNRMAVFVQWCLVGLGIILVILAGIWLIKKRVARLVNIEKEKNRLRINWYEQETKVLAAQMNPHFVFNSLNTIQQFIISNDNKNAQIYLSKFSRLMRKILESSTRNMISLKEEIDMYEKYLEIESLRFSNAFSYTITIPEDINPDHIYIPHFLVQPFIENAVWHGLLPKQGERLLSVSFERSGTARLVCQIEDNGIGRKNSESFSSDGSKSSLAIGFVEQRLQLLSKLRNDDYSLRFIDKKDVRDESAGTCVILIIPILKETC